MAPQLSASSDLDSLFGAEPNSRAGSLAAASEDEASATSLEAGMGMEGVD